MRTVVRPLFFNTYGSCVIPRDKELHDKAVEFCQRELSGKISFGDYRDIYIAYREGTSGEILEVTGISCGVLKYDIPVIRFLDSKSGKKLMERINDRLEDSGVQVGTEVFVFVKEDEATEQRCSAQDDWIKNWAAQKSHRLSVRVR